jgi:hypothetical protein
MALPAEVGDPAVVGARERVGEVRREMIGVGRVQREARIERGALDALAVECVDHRVGGESPRGEIAETIDEHLTAFVTAQHLAHPR